MIDAIRVRSAIETAARAEMDLPEGIARDVAFHMLDWLEDLEAYYQFCQAPDARTTEQVERILTNFLVHVPNRLAAASKLYMGIPVTDIFGVGATTETE